jgi:uncharacterized protein YbjT (DUF2867 family)
VTGGTGVLGREVVTRLLKAGEKVRIMSRREGASNAAGDAEWAQANLATGDGLPEAVGGVDTIVHCASDPFGQTKEADVDGTGRLIDAAKAAGAGHLYYISIVGIEKIDYPYYRSKLAAENVIVAGGLPFTILRATQFHPLLDRFLATLMRRGPFLLVPGAMQYQLIDVGEVADHMVETMAKGPSGRLPDIGGPKVQTAKEIARAWLKASGRRLIRIPVPTAGSLSGFAKGYNCCPDNAFGKITWEEWLQKTYADR